MSSRITPFIRLFLESSLRRRSPHGLSIRPYTQIDRTSCLAHASGRPSPTAAVTPSLRAPPNYLSTILPSPMPAAQRFGTWAERNSSLSRSRLTRCSGRARSWYYRAAYCRPLCWRSGRLRRYCASNSFCCAWLVPRSTGCAMPTVQVQRASLLYSALCGKVAARPSVVNAARDKLKLFNLAHRYIRLHARHIWSHTHG